MVVLGTNPCHTPLWGEDKLKVENDVMAASYLGPTNEFCENLYERLLEDQELKVLLEKLETIHQSCMKVRENILASSGFQFENS